MPNGISVVYFISILLNCSGSKLISKIRSANGNIQNYAASSTDVERYLKTVPSSETHVIITKPMTQQDAQVACEKLDMILAEPKNLPLLSDVAMVGSTLSAEDRILDDQVWIGLQFGKNKCWSWISSGTCADTQLVSWILGSAEVNASPGGILYEYGLVLDLRTNRTRMTGLSQDLSSGKKFPFACQKTRSDFDKCLVEGTGTMYMGGVHHTHLGRHCIPWKQEYVERYLDMGENPNNTDLYFRDGASVWGKDTCRNPDQDLGGPWCFVSVGGTIQRETCFIHSCQHYPTIQMVPRTPGLSQYVKISSNLYQVTIPMGCSLRISCRVTNAVRPVEFSWMLGPQTLLTKTKMTLLNNNSTDQNLTLLSAESNLSFSPSLSDNGKNLVCATSWPQEMQIGVNLNVQYTPQFIGRKFVVKFVRLESKIVIRIYFLSNPAPLPSQVIWSIGNLLIVPNKDVSPSLTAFPPYLSPVQHQPMLYTAKLEMERVTRLPMHINLEVMNKLGSSGKFRIMLLEAHNNDTSQDLIYQRLPHGWTNPALSVAVIFLISMVLAAILVTYVQSRRSFDPYYIFRRNQSSGNNSNMASLLKLPKKVNNSVQCVA